MNICFPTADAVWFRRGLGELLIARAFEDNNGLEGGQRDVEYDIADHTPMFPEATELHNATRTNNIFPSFLDECHLNYHHFHHLKNEDQSGSSQAIALRIYHPGQETG